MVTRFSRCNENSHANNVHMAKDEIGRGLLLYLALPISQSVLHFNWH